MDSDRNTHNLDMKKARFSERKLDGGTFVPPSFFTPMETPYYKQGILRLFLTMQARRGFTIMEIVVSLILLGIGVLAVGQGYRAGRFFLRQSDNRSVAISVVSRKMDEYLAKSYESLVEGQYSSNPDDPDPKKQPEKNNGTVFNWNVEISKELEGTDDPAAGRQTIPYKLITAVCTYQDRNLAGALENNELRMINIVSYPPIHTEIMKVPPEGTSFAAGTAPQVPSGAGAASPIITLQFAYETNKDLLIIYNITIRVRDATGLGDLDTIYTELFLNGQRKDIVTRTPIMMQPLISNAIGIENVTKDGNPYTLEVRWYKETEAANAGVVELKESNLMILATEHH